jgi:flagellar hook protein FlgE
MPNFSIALTGLQADSTALNVIGNNLSNLNTTAFKGQTTTFEDLFYQQLGVSGSGEDIQAGAGVKVAGTSSDFSQGSLTTTTNSTDMALNGDGFFVAQNGASNELTRDGNFQLSNTGVLQTTDGLPVMGFAAANGVVSSTGNLTPISLPIGGNTAAYATQNFSIDGNLDATSAVGGQFTTSVQMFDSLGETHTATVTFTKASATNWNYAITLPSGDATGTPVNNTGTLIFNSSGVLTSTATSAATPVVTTPAVNLAGIQFPGLTDGAAPLTVDWNLFSSTTGLPTVAQSASASNATASSQDGYASGTYQSFTVDTKGLVSATFSNGHTQVMGQLAIASVANEGGLTKIGANNYITSAASGAASFEAAGVGTRGSIQDDALEGSNVDISTEFSELIIAQRAFQANSKTVTTFDSVTEDAINMIR